VRASAVQKMAGRVQPRVWWSRFPSVKGVREPGEQKTHPAAFLGRLGGTQTAVKNGKRRILSPGPVHHVRQCTVRCAHAPHDRVPRIPHQAVMAAATSRRRRPSARPRSSPSIATPRSPASLVSLCARCRSGVFHRAGSGARRLIKAAREHSFRKLPVLDMSQTILTLAGVVRRPPPVHHRPGAKRAVRTALWVRTAESAVGLRGVRG
jgi:hypothetical protein